MTESTATRRPGLLTLVTIYIWIVAIASLLVGAVVTIGSFNDEVIAETGRTATELQVIGITELAIGVIAVLVALALAGGSNGARTLVAVLAVLRILATVFLVAFAHTSGYLIAGVLHILLPLFILWVLYGNDKVEAYFEANG